jgi:serine/threonine protein phosphatase PrpC
MSRDHKPELPDESERIYSHGGVVERSSVNSTTGPFRVWVKNENHPGLAMSRSIGDFVAESVGVVSTPEVNVFKREDVKAKAIVIASDGVWEYVSNEKVKGIIWDYYNRNDAEGCANAIKENAVRMWNANGDIMDDITVVVVFM